MIFKPELVEAIVGNLKTVTRRKSDRYRVGSTYAVQPGRGKKGVARIRVVDVRAERFDPKAITWAEARREGFRGGEHGTAASAFRQAWGAIHGSLDPIDVYRIEFELVEILPVSGESGDAA